ncbi:SIMPL domain-containing protein [Desulfotalea psychrophila]|uniref:DUF541 domain-containing protein n=1 Tax=Desulfotalea psychrophila (strain LSv54 / DSM 12343) TaxID=177439 RepID=Q6AM82_DESPS|nr:SIMPL domain-containing protein [Desulfotalea psychrophila]CAG36543.1 conserved hypothetical protein [Desulfotalea psychrophila LSv54]
MRILMAVCMVFLMSLHAQAGPLPAAPHIVVAGGSEVKAVPDTLSMSLQIIEVGRDAEQARAEVEKRARKLIETAKGLGIKAGDINSAALSVTPKYNWKNNQQIYTGTEVSRSVALTLRDLSKYDALIQAVLKSNVVRINSTQLSSSKDKEIQAEALQKAVADAKIQAQLLVAGLPQQVGDVYAINATSRPMQAAPAMYRMAAQVNDSAFEPGTLSYSKSVQVVFYLISR